MRVVVSICSYILHNITQYHHNDGRYELHHQPLSHCKFFVRIIELPSQWFLLRIAYNFSYKWLWSF